MDKRAAELLDIKKSTRHSLGARPVNHIRSTTLSICSLFSLSRAEVADLSSCLETVDSTFSKHVNIFQFCELFCPRWKQTFKYLFSQYESLPMFPQNDRKSNAATSKGKNSHPVSYVNLFSFLFLLVPLQPNDLCKFLFLVCFEHLKIRPKCENITETAKLLWGDRDGGRKAVASVKFVSRSVDIEVFDSSKLESYDTSSKLSFTTPMIKLITELRKNICNKQFWVRVAVKTQVLKADYTLYCARVERLRDMLEASEECEIVDTVKEMAGKIEQLDSFEMCFAYVHKIERGFRSLKRESDKRQVNVSLAQKVVEIPVNIYKKYFGARSFESQYKHQKVVPFREKATQYNMKGFSSADLFSLADRAVYHSEDVLDASAATLEEGKRKDVEINKVLKAMKKASVKAEPSTDAGEPYDDFDDAEEMEEDAESERDEGEVSNGVAHERGSFDEESNHEEYGEACEFATTEVAGMAENRDHHGEYVEEDVVVEELA